MIVMIPSQIKLQTPFYTSNPRVGEIKPYRSQSSHRINDSVTSSKIPWHRGVALPSQSRALAPRNNLLECSPAQQADCTNDESPHNNLVLVAVTLEAQRRDILLCSALAKADALLETERLCALGTRLGLGARLQLRADLVCGGKVAVVEDCRAAELGRGSFTLGAEGDDGAVLEACAFAKGRRGCDSSLDTSLLETRVRGEHTCCR